MLIYNIICSHTILSYSCNPVLFIRYVNWTFNGSRPVPLMPASHQCMLSCFLASLIPCMTWMYNECAVMSEEYELDDYTISLPFEVRKQTVRLRPCYSVCTDTLTKIITVTNCPIERLIAVLSPMESVLHQMRVKDRETNTRNKSKLLFAPPIVLVLVAVVQLYSSVLLMSVT